MFQRRLGYIALLCVVFFSIQNVQAENWFQFRGPDGLGISDAKNLPVTWSETENVAWKTAMPGYGASSPIALDGKLYVTCYSGYAMGRNQGRMEDLTFHVVCVDRQTGKILWDKKIKPLLPETKKVRDHGYTAQTPVTDGEHLYIFFGKTGVFKFDLNGNPIWQTSVGTDLNSWGSGTSPILYKDLLIVNASVESQTLVALDRETGQVKWRAGNIKQSWNTPIITTSESGRRELVLAIKGKVLGFEPDAGRLLWSSDTDIRWYMTPSLIAAEGIVYALGGRSGTAALAVRTGGSGDVTATHRLWTSTKGSNVSSPVIHKGHLYWMHEQRGIAFCAKAATGEIVYEQRLSGARQVYASVLLADGRLYYLDRTGKTFVLAAKPKSEQLACNTLDDRSTFNASPIVCDGALILRSDENMYCIKKMN